MITIYYNAVSGQIVRVGQGANPALNLQAGEDYVLANPPKDPFLYRVNVTTKVLEELPTAAPSRTWQEIRNLRDRFLQASDWTQLPDSGLTTGQVLTARGYRTALRDITTTFVDPNDVVFPTPPSFLES